MSVRQAGTRQAIEYRSSRSLAVSKKQADHAENFAPICDMPEARSNHLKKKAFGLTISGTSAVTLTIVLAMFCALQLNAQGNPPKYEVDLSWPKPLPNMWVTGSVGGVCTDAQDHV